MRKYVLVLASIIAAVSAAGCADDYYAAGYNGGPAYGPDVDVYYDGFYGPYGGGYWGDGGVFYYSDGHGRHIRDGGHHFRHRPFGHAEHFHGGGFHGRPGDHGH